MNSVFLTLLPCMLAPLQEAQTQETQTRVFDLSALALAVPEASTSGIYVQLLPLIRAPRLHVNGEWDAEEWSLPDLFAEILVEATEDRPEHVDFIPPHSIVVRGTAAQLARCEKTIAAAETALMNSPRLEVTTFSGLAEAPPAVLSSAEFDAIMGGASSIARREIALASGRAIAVRDLIIDTASLGAQIQIAQGASIVDSEMFELATGFTLDLVADVSNGHTNLSYAVTQTVRDETVDAQKASVMRQFSRENGSIFVDDSNSWSEAYGVKGGVLVGEADLGAGSVIVFGVSGAGAERSYVGLRLANGGEVNVDPIVIATEGEQSVWVIPGEHMAEGGDSPVRFDAAAWRYQNDAESIYDGDALYSLVHAPGRPNIYETYDSVMELWFAAIPGAVILKGDALDNEGIAQIMAGQNDRAKKLLAVGLAVAGVPPRSSASAQFALNTGSTSKIVAGREVLLPTDDSVEVAQFAGASEPKIVTHFEGFMGTVALTVTRSGALAYEIRGQVSSNIAIRPSSAESAGAVGLVAPSTRVVEIDERGVAKANETGGWTIVAGDREGNSAGVILEVHAND